MNRIVRILAYGAFISSSEVLSCHLGLDQQSHWNCKGKPQELCLDLIFWATQNRFYFKYYINDLIHKWLLMCFMLCNGKSSLFSNLKLFVQFALLYPAVLLHSKSFYKRPIFLYLTNLNNFTGKLKTCRILFFRMQWDKEYLKVNYLLDD